MSEPKSYRHNPKFIPDSPFLSDEAMIEVFNGRPTLCVDILLVDKTTKELILPWRTRKPAEGPWFFGGMIKRNMSPKRMASHIISKEAGIEIPEDKLVYLDASWFEWDYRDGEGSENGRVDFNLCYIYEPTSDELDAIEASLSSDEYDTQHGLQRYTRDLLSAAITAKSPCKQVLVDYYDQLF